MYARDAKKMVCPFSMRLCVADDCMLWHRSPEYDENMVYLDRSTNGWCSLLVLNSMHWNLKSIGETLLKLGDMLERIERKVTD